MHLDLLIIVFGLTVIFISSLVQGINGFGFSLLAVPLLTLFIPQTEVTPILIIFGVLSNIAIVIKIYKHIKLSEIWVLILFGIIGIPFGTLILKDSSILKLITGIVILGASIMLISGFTLKTKNKTFASIIAGLLSGFLNGSLSMSGPPIVLFLSNQGVDKDYFRANITAYGVITNIIALLTLALKGFINVQVITYSGIFLPGMIIGVSTGIFISGKVNEALFKKLTLFLILTMGVYTIITTLIRFV